MFGNTGLAAVLTLAIFGFIYAQIQQDGAAGTPCDISHAGSCPANQCCVRNESKFDQMECVSLGGDGDLCANYTSQFICPCQTGFFCKQNPSNLFSTCKSPPVTDKPCNISATHDTCPRGFCCVHDEFLYTYTHCKRYGEPGDSCVTKPSDNHNDCPCKDGLVCNSNLHGNPGSVYGTCQTSGTQVG